MMNQRHLERVLKNVHTSPAVPYIFGIGMCFLQLDYGLRKRLGLWAKVFFSLSILNCHNRSGWGIVGKENISTLTRVKPHWTHREWTASSGVSGLQNSEQDEERAKFKEVTKTSVINIFNILMQLLKN